MQKQFYLSIASILLAMFVLTAHAQILVLKSTGTHAPVHYRAGTVIDENTSIELQNGDQIVLLSGQATRTFDGPARITPAEVFSNNAISGKLAALAEFLISSSEERTELGTVRSGDDLPADPWVVNVTKPGLKCIIVGQPLILWRGMDIPGDHGIISSGNGAPAVVFSWPPGEAEVDWPGDMKWKPGETLVVDYGLDKTIEFQLRTMPSEIVDNGARLVWLAEQGCIDQVSVLLDRI